MAKRKSSRKTSRRHQKMYNMKGCSKTRKHYLGGSPDAPLAYTGKPTPSVPNPFFAYTGKGGSSCGLSNPETIPVNTNAANPTMPNTGPPIQPNTIYNNASQQLGGSCGCGMPSLIGGARRRGKGMSGGCGQCGAGFMVGGVRHRSECKCSDCKDKMMKGGNAGIPYPNGLVGSPWTASNNGWPGVNGIDGDRNYIAYNNYHTDISRQMVDLGASPPFLNGGQKKHRRKQRGGSLSNFMGQDLVNLGRQFQFGVGSAYNALAGYSAPINPMPWKDQFPNKIPLNSVAL